VPPEQTVVQLPQWFGSLLVLASHPSVRGFMSQSLKGAVQAIAQLPPEQLAVPLAALQTAPQPPQFEVSLPVLVSQPLFGFMSQLAKFGLQTGVHVPPTHDVEPFPLVH
jgi:hypothetical protein